MQSTTRLFRQKLQHLTRPNSTELKPPSSVQPRKAANTEIAPYIYILGTGGTIAGTAESATAANYAASKLCIADVIKSIKDLNDYGDKLQTIDLFQVNSEDMTPQHWLQIAKQVNTLLASDSVKGVVITHGTDTLEETAYFLHLVVHSDKPVVLVGAMRAATSLSADGPLNLYNAIQLIESPNSHGKGVMVMMNDTIYDARDVTKCNTTQVNTFNSPNSGPNARINFGKAAFYRTVMRKHTSQTPFDIMQIDKLPEVEIVLEYAGSRGTALKAAIEAKPAGIVIAGVGDGNLPATDRALLKYAEDAGIQVVRSSRTGSGRITENSDDYPASEHGTIAGDDLNPQKARILLMLSLTQTNLKSDIRNNFNTF